MKYCPISSLVLATATPPRSRACRGAERLEKAARCCSSSSQSEVSTVRLGRSSKRRRLSRSSHLLGTPQSPGIIEPPMTPQLMRIQQAPRILESPRTPTLPRITRQPYRGSQLPGTQQSPRIPESPKSTQLPRTQHESRILESLRTLRSPRVPQLLKTAQSPRTPESTGTQHSPRIEKTPTTPQQEPHLHLRTRETFDCFLRTKVYVNRQWTIVMPRVYRELFTNNSWSISIESQFYISELVNLSRNLNTSFGCTVYHSDYDQYCCALRFRVPKGMYVAVSILEHVGSSILKVMDESLERAVDVDFTVTEDNGERARVLVSSFDVVSVLSVLNLPSPTDRVHDRLRLEFQAVSNPGLQVRYTSANKGFVQTLFYQDKHSLLNPQHGDWVEIKVPAGHVILISSPALKYIEQCLALLAGDRGNETLIRVCPDNLDPPPATIFNTSLLVIHLEDYVERGRASVEGFRLHFSFHNVSAAFIPTKLPDSSWNCSVPFVSDFLYHLSCNLEVECHNAEDEMNCSYSSDLCGPRYLTLGEGCFFYVKRKEEKVTWGEASRVCTLRGGRLAKLNTVSKWLDTVRLLPTPQFGESLVFVGVRNTPSALPLWYTNMYQWTDDTIALYLNPIITGNELIPARCVRRCGFMSLSTFVFPKSGSAVLNFDCKMKQEANILCEKPLPVVSAQELTLTNDNRTNRWLSSRANSMYVACPLGHYTHQFLACDVRSSCWQHHSSRCEPSLTSLPPSFACADERERVPYTLVCDHRKDCLDESDEDFCWVPVCTPQQFSCDNGQCIQLSKACDGWGDCEKYEDEEQCASVISLPEPILPPAFVSLSPDGLLGVSNITETAEGTCPHTHFQCLNEGHCLPVFLRCNDVYDCPGREDERACEACPGFYRCRGSTVCLLHSDLCDGHAHCPQHDDELACELTCPPFCVCVGMAFFCSRSFVASDCPLLRYLDASGSDMTPAFLKSNVLLIHLIIAHSNLTLLNELDLPNLLVLDVHDSQLRAANRADLAGVPQLRELSLAGNPLAHVFKDVSGSDSSLFIHELDLSRVSLHVLNVTAFSAFPSLRVLNLSHSGVQRILGEGFGVIEQLSEIDLRGCPMTWFSRGLLQGLDNLQTVYAHSFKVCCPAVLPRDFNLHNCFAPSDEISSCDDLLGSRAYQVCAFLLSAVALFGNAVSFVFRMYVSKRESKLGYGNFVTHLSVSDFVMGIYLAVIGVADQVHKGAYLWNDLAWRHSAACKLAGFLSLLSSEVSALIMCLITMDRFLALQFPFSRLYFGPGSAHAASVVVWICGVLLVSVPLLPVTSHWEFYSQTGICIPLPVSRTNFAGNGYSFAIIIVFNFVLFVFISMGQLSIYWSVRANAMSVSNTTKKTKDLTIARRLITVAMSDFLCWFPIGVLGLMASKGFAIPGEVNVAVAIFVLPLNAAVNPCLYTLNVILERRTRAREEKFRALLLAQIKGHN